MRRLLLTLLAALVAAYLGFCLLLWATQRSMIYLPPLHHGTGACELETLDVPGATLAVCVRPRPGAAATLYFGGNAEDVAWSLEELALAFPDQALYLLQYRGFGASTGAPSEAALYGDSLALYDRVHAAHPEIVVVGRSLGSTVAVRLASLRRVTRLVLVTPFDSLARLGAHYYPLFPVRWLLRDRYEAWRHAPAVTAPTLLVVAERDEIVPRERAEALLASFPPGVARLEVVPGAGHNTISGHSGYLELLGGGR